VGIYRIYQFYHTARFLVKQFVKRNAEFLKRTSSGNDLVVYCGHRIGRLKLQPCKTQTFDSSEDAIVNLTRGLAKLGWEVTVYDQRGHGAHVNAGVTYRPSWEFNPKDRQDAVILWGLAKPIDWDINADRIYVDPHDTVDERDLNRYGRLEKISRVFLNSPSRRSLFPNIPEHKIVVVPDDIHTVTCWDSVLRS
jgi:hypothetical protein